MGQGHLVLTNGVVSVTLRHASISGRMSVRDGGYRQQVARPQGQGTTWAPVIDAFELVFTDPTDEDRAVELQQLGYLMISIDLYKRSDGIEPTVWLEARTPSETERRYAVVTDLWMNELDGRHWRARSYPQMTLYVEREGLWRKHQPLQGWATVKTESIFQVWDDAASEANRVQILPDEVDGDAPALTRLTVEFTSGTGGLSREKLIGAKSSKDQAALNRFVPWFNAVDETNEPSLHVTDALEPGGERIEVTTSGSGIYFLEWDLPGSATSADYVGTYLVHAICEVDTDDIISIGFDSQNRGSGGAKLYPLASSSSHEVVFLGRHEIYPERIPGDPVTPATRPLKIHVVYSGAATLKFYSFALVPVDAGLCGADYLLLNGTPIGASEVWDSEIQRTYLQSGGSVHLDTFRRRRVGGFIELRPDMYTNLYLFAAPQNEGLAQYIADHEFDFTVEVVPRFRALS